MIKNLKGRIKKMINLNRITTKGKALFLAYDQGLEHGPTDFNDKNVDPRYIIDIAKKGGYSAIILQKGIVEKYYSELKECKVPLILKLNGKTNLVREDPVSPQLCTVKEAIKFGADAVGYTIYIGSEHENIMLREFEGIQEKAHEANLPVIAWIYPRGKYIRIKSSKELMAYAARSGLEIGADIIKIQYNGNIKDLKWAVKNAGKTRVVIAGGMKKEERLFLKQAKDIMQTGCIGLAIGRNIWQSKDPLSMTAKVKKIIWG
jgi:class I fructose-bisphosphate aldolase